MNGLVTRSKVASIILGICLTILGIVFFINPIESTVFLVSILGWVFVIGGIATFITYLRSPSDERSGADIFLGVVEIIFGAIVLFFPGMSIAAIAITIGCVIFMTGIFDIIESISLHNIEGSRWGFWLFIGIITTILGILTFVAPFAWIEVLMIYVAISLIFDGITEIIIGASL